ncbi:MAG TPA: hypothetical protein VGL53_12005 [Bryobacteraceae bacterium]
MEVRIRGSMIVVCLLAAGAAFAQTPTPKEEPDWRQVLQRLDRLEAQNKALVEEIRALREELAGKSVVASAPAPTPAPTEGMPTTAPLEERVGVLEQRTAEHEQSKIGTEHRMPVELTGMLLFNSFIDGRNASGTQAPLIAGVNPDASPLIGGTFRQSIFGLKFQGPKIFANGEVTGSVSVDLFGGTGVPLNQAVRLRVATLDLNWTNTTLSVAHDTPIIAPREPTSMAQVGVSPLTAAGNLWYWQPQIRLEQRFALGSSVGLKAQLGVIQTNEGAATTPSEYSSTLVATRPGFEGRFELWKRWSDNARIEIAEGFHASETHVGGEIVPSRIYSIDWLIRPFSKIDLTGTWFYNQNSTVLGGLRPGLLFAADGSIRPVTGTAEWAQLAFHATSRMTFNLYGGQASNHQTDIMAGSILNNRTIAANVIYKLSTNVLASFEMYQARTRYLGLGKFLVPHYDLALAYLF